jgi:hypothetical protein
MELLQVSVEEIVETEKQLVLNAASHYGQYASGLTLTLASLV